MTPKAENMTKVAVASFVGALMEWYDFFLYGTASALVFNKLFFPNLDPMVGTIAAFATFAVGFVARPLGGIIFGHYGDRVGRKTILIITILVMGIGTFLIGLIPSYHSIGIWATVLLVTFRVLQGIGLGGEYGGAALMTIEHAPRKERGFWASLPQAATSAGLLLATGVFAIVSRLPEEDFLSWGWRIPFLISIVLLWLGLYIRLNIAETPAFLNLKQKKSEAKVPLFELLRCYPKNILSALGARLAETVSSNIFNAFGIAYVTKLGFAKDDALMGILVASAIGIFACPFYGWLSDRIGRRPIYMAGVIFLILFAYPFFWLLGTKDKTFVWLAIILGYTLGPTLVFSVQSVFFSEMFGTRVRYSGLSVAYQMSSIVGGFTPMIATTLFVAGGNQPWYVAAFLVGISLISFVATLVVAETYKKDVAEIEEGGAETAAS